MKIRTKLAGLALAGALLGGVATVAAPAEPAEAFTRWCSIVQKKEPILGQPWLGYQTFTYCYTSTNQFERNIGIRHGWYWVPGDWA